MTALVIRTIFCLLIVTTSAQNNTRKPLDTVIDELSSIARVTNGIAIEAGKRKMEEVVAEFMGLRSADVIGKMKQMKVTDVVGKLAELKPLVEKVAKLTVNTSDIQKSFEALEEMKKNADVLGKQVSDPGGELEKEIKEVAKFSSDFSKYYKVETFTEVVGNLSYIKNTADVNDAVSPVDTLNKLKESIENVARQFSYFEIYDRYPLIMNVWKLENTNERLSEVSKLAVLSEQFTTNFPTLSSMESILGDLKNGISNLKAVAEQQKSMPDVVTSLEDMSAVAVEVSNASPSVRLTAGLAGGVGDLKLMFEDLKGDRMRKMIAGGKETTELAEKMADVSDLHAKLEGLDGTWKQFDRQKYVGALKKVPLLLSDAMNSSQFVPDMDSTVTSLESLQKCFTDLKMPPQPPDYKQVRDIIDYGRKLSTQITQYKEFMGSRNETFQDTEKMVNNLTAVLKPLKQNLWNVTKQVWGNINKSSEMNQLISSLSTLHKDFQQFVTENPFLTIKQMNEEVDWTVFQPLLKSLDNTNLLSMINCLGSVSYQSKDIDAVLIFGGSVNAMKSEVQSFTETNEFLSQMSKVQQGLMQVEGAGKQSKRGRRRRDVGAKSVGSLKNAEEVSVDLGRGVQVLRQLSRIVDEEKSVMVAADADDVLKKTIDAIRGSQSVWTDENRDSLKKVVSDVNKLNDVAANMTRDTMSALWLVFDAARQVPQVQIDAKVFGDPIATGLSSSADPKMQAAAGDFKVLATLDLDFVQHHHRLKAATLTLVSLRQFFDDFFDLTPDVSVAAPIIQTKTSGDDIETSNDESSVLSIIIHSIAIISLIAAICVTLFFMKEYLEQQKLYNKREEIWFYEDLYPENKLKNELSTAVRCDSMEAKECIKKGALLDFYDCGKTPLHWAVINANPEMVKMLIRGGADRSLRSFERLTAEEMAKKMLESEVFKDKHENCLKVLAVFEKYANKTFKCKVRRPLPVKDYFIEIKCAGNKQFADKFASCIHKSEDSEERSSHIVVDTDQDKAYDVNDPSAIKHIFSSTILVDSSWLAACLEDKKNLERAYDYRVTKVRFNGKVYETVDEWKKMANMRTLRLLEGVELTFKSDKVAGEENAEKDAIETVLKLFGNYVETLEALYTNSRAGEHPDPFWFPEKKSYWIVYKAEDEKAAVEDLDDMADEAEMLEKKRKADEKAGKKADEKSNKKSGVKADKKADEKSNKKSIKMAYEKAGKQGFDVKVAKEKLSVVFEFMSLTEFFDLCLSLEPFSGKMPVVKPLEVVQSLSVYP